MTESTNNITWENENTGMEQRYNSSSRVYKYSYALRLIIDDYCKQLCSNPKGLLSGEYREFVKYYFSPLDNIRPHPLSSLEKARVIDSINEHVPKALVQYITSLETPGDDFTFLMKLGLKRDWKAGCVICLSDDMMGTTCTCGHTEIAVFRPCGHSVCVNPCFNLMMEKISIDLQPTTIESTNGVRFEIPTKLNINDCGNFDCPTCRQKVDRCFRAEDVRVGKEMSDTIFSRLPPIYPN